MYQIQPRTIAQSILALALLGPVTTQFQSASAQGFGETRLAQSSSAHKKLLDGLVSKEPEIEYGRMRGVVLGAPVPRPRPRLRPSHRKQKLQNIIRKSTTRAPALSGPVLREQPSLGDQPSEQVAVTVAPVPQMTKADRDDLKKIAVEAELPAVDLEIYFKYNSAELNPRSVPDLVLLGRVLMDPKLKGSTFMVAGYTDAKGGSRYNQSLSERRARTVQEFLLSTFSIDANKLLPVGYGKDHLKNRDNPYAAENRRVQIVNLSAIK